MNRKGLTLVVAGVFVIGWIALRTQGNARREIEQERGYVEILERTEGGHAEQYTRILPLAEGFTKAGERIDWYAATYADPAKPQFAFAFRNVAEPKDDWQAAAKEPLALWVDGRRHEMKPYQALVGDDGAKVTMASVGGSRSILQALDRAKAAEIEFGGRRSSLDGKALANCRELLKRSEGKAKE
jgi:hypothetical protein